MSDKLCMYVEYVLKNLNFLYGRKRKKKKACVCVCVDAFLEIKHFLYVYYMKLIDFFLLLFKMMIYLLDI